MIGKGRTESGLAESANLFAGVQSAMIADVLDGLGYMHCTLPPQIRPLGPGMAMAGPAFTIRGRATPEPVDRLEVMRRALRWLGATPPHHVVVVEANDGDTYSAHVGEFHATMLQARGAAGTVTQGGARDADQIAKLGYPVFCGYNTPQDGLPRWEMTEVDTPIQIGSVKINPGDYVVADTDGVVIVPADVCEDVLKEARAFATGESEILEQVKKGVDALEALEAAGGGSWKAPDEGVF